MGLGPHAQACQYAYLEHYHRKGLQIRLLVELQDKQKDVENFLQNREFQPQEIVGLPTTDRTQATIHPQLLTKLEKIKSEIDGLIMCAEPKAHKKYILWALKNNIDVLTDKPLTAPLTAAEDASETIWQDYVEIKQAAANSRASVCLMTNKRVHPAYQSLYNCVQKFQKQYPIPITHIDISEGGGIWNFPQEYDKENHPYKYGYGVLLHTGFHYIDLLLYYQQLNHKIGFAEDQINTHAFATTPYDITQQLTQPLYEKLFPKQNFSVDFMGLEKYKSYGAIDVISSWQFVRDNVVITQAGLSMLQNTLSAREERLTPANPYSGSGRLTQLSVRIFAGPLFYAQLSLNQPDLLEDDQSDTYILETYRNTSLTGGESYTREEFPDLLMISDTQGISLNSASKREIIRQWVEDGNCPATQLDKHERSIQLTSQLTRDITAHRK